MVRERHECLRRVTFCRLCVNNILQESLLYHMQCLAGELDCVQHSNPPLEPFCCSKNFHWHILQLNMHWDGLDNTIGLIFSVFKQMDFYSRTLHHVCVSMSVCIVCCVLQGEFYEAVHWSAAAGHQLFVPASPLCFILLLWPLQTFSHWRQQVYRPKGTFTHLFSYSFPHTHTHTHLDSGY